MIETRLKKLAAAIRDAVVTRKDAGLLQTHRRIWVRRRAFGVKYLEDPGFANFPPERSEHEVWNSDDFRGFQDTVITAMDEYKSVLSHLVTRTHMLNAFVGKVALAAFSGLGDSELAEQAKNFAIEIDGLPLQVRIKGLINGLSLIDSPIQVSDHLTLRRPIVDDVAEHILLDEYGGFSFPLPDAWFNAVGEFTIKAINAGDAQTRFLLIFDAMTLFRVGGVASPRYQMHWPHSVLQGGGIIGSSPQQLSRFKYQLSLDDAGSLATFLRDIAPLLPDPFSSHDSARPAHIAYTRYKDALFQNGPAERAITSAMTCLEALFLTGEPELTHRLAQRVAVFLGGLGAAEAPQIYDHVSRGYKIRSKFIHGGSLDVDTRPAADQLLPVLVEYARGCTLGFLQLTIPKERFLKQLDRALLDPNSISDLGETLATLRYR